MASRLTRWSVATVVGVATLLVFTLPPKQQFLTTFYDFRTRTPTNALDGAVTANAQAISTAVYTLEWIESQRRLAPFLASRRSPLVIWHDGSRTEVEPEMTAAAEALWRTIPASTDAPRTLILVSNDLNYRGLRVNDPGLCIGTATFVRTSYQTVSGVNGSAGGCFLATLYGMPGAGLAGWVDTVRSIEVPGRVVAMPTELRDVPPAERQWAEPRGDFRRPDDRFAWWAPAPVRACAGGREEQCVAALGLGPDGLASFPRWQWVYERGLERRLLAVLHAEVGPDRFREIWRSSDPLPVAYERATGAPFAPWAKRFVQIHTGRLVKDNALSLPGWLGWALWMTLLMVWFATRIRGKEAL